MRVLVSTTPGWGHVHPMVPVARALQEAGHDVVWATAAPTCPRVEGFRFTARPAGIDAATRRARLLESGTDLRAIPHRQQRPAAYAGLFASVAAPAMAPDLLAVAHDVGPDVVVHEAAELAGPLVARTAGIPHVAVGFGDFIPMAALAAADQALVPLYLRYDLPAPDRAGLYDQLYLHPLPASMGSDPPAPTVRRIRPDDVDGDSDRSTGHEPGPAWLAGFGSERPGVYVTFGTEFAPAAPFAAVLGALADLDVDAVVTTGPQVDPDQLEPRPANVRVESYVPQRFVIDRSRVVVSHGGSGVALGAARAGRPQVCLPLGADQFENADGLQRAGVAIVVEPGAADVATVRRAVNAALTSTDHGAAAARLEAELTDLPPVAEVVPVIEGLS